MNNTLNELEAILTNTNIPETLSFYNGTETILYDDALHAYYRNTSEGPELVPGVTTVIGIINKPALVQWAANKTSEYIKDHCKYVNIKIQGQTYQYAEKEFIEGLLNEARFNFKKISKEATDIGKIAHGWLEAYVKGIISGNEGYVPPQPDDTKAINCINAAIQWFVKHQFKPTNSECKIYSRNYSYSGTYDWTGYVTACGDIKCCPFTGTIRALGDFKSSNALYDEYRMQSAAYLCAHEEEYPEDEIFARIILRLGKEDGEFETEVLLRDSLEHDFTGFLGALTAYNWQKVLELKKKYAKEEAKAAAKEEKEAAKLVEKLEKAAAKEALKAAKAAEKAANKLKEKALKVKLKKEKTNETITAS